jgi:hypothetical protein
MNDQESRMLKTAAQRKQESDSIDPSQTKNHPFAKAAVARTVSVPDFETKSSAEFMQHITQIKANDPDLPAQQALLQQDDRAA